MTVSELIKKLETIERCCGGDIEVKIQDSFDVARVGYTIKEITTDDIKNTGICTLNYLSKV